MSRRYVAGVLLLGLIQGLEPSPVVGAPVEGTVASPAAVAEAETAFEQGVALYRSGEKDEALVVFRGFLVRHADSPLLDKATLYMARIFLDQGRYPEALLYLERIPADRRGTEARFIEGVALVETGETVGGMALLLPLQQAPLFETDKARLFAALAKGHARQGQPLKGLFFLRQALDLGGERDPILAEAHRILGGTLGDGELEEAAFLFKGTAIGQDATLQRAWRALAAGRTAAARQLVEELQRDSTPFPYRREVAQLQDRLAGGRWLQRDTVGVILPLSGRYATFGTLARRGIELAGKVHEAEHPPVRFIFRDTGTDPEQSAKAIAQLANEERVMAIIGPLSANAALGASQRAQEEGIPMIALSHREGVPETGDYVYRNSLTNQMQARALARYAVTDRGITAFGVLHPQEKQGEELTELFAQEVKKLGGLVVEVESYPVKSTDFRRQILRFKGENPDAPEEEASPPLAEGSGEPLPQAPKLPAVTFDALFIPDYAERVGLIAPQLAFYGLEGVQLLGINGWNSPDLVRRAGKYVEKAVFVDGFFRYSPYPFVKEFVDLYYQTYGEEPSILEAQAYDTALILLSLLAREEIGSREELRLALSRLQNYPGVTGATSFNLQGEAEKVLFLLQVKNGNIDQIN